MIEIVAGVIALFWLPWLLEAVFASDGAQTSGVNTAGTASIARGLREQLAKAKAEEERRLRGRALIAGVPVDVLRKPSEQERHRLWAQKQQSPRP